MDKTMHFRFL